MRESLDPAARPTPSPDRLQGNPGPPSRAESRSTPHLPSQVGHRPWHECFAERCTLAPEHPAIIDMVDGSTLTYGALELRIGRRRRSLRAAGVGPEVPVAVLLDDPLERLVTILAIVSAGGAYVPLDPGYPTQRWHLILEDTAAPLLITDRPPREVDQALPEACRALALPALDALHSTTPADKATIVCPQATAYIIYTSGSTGRPRGVSVEHRALAWYSAACSDHYGLGPADRLPQMASISFDISVGEIFPCLASGGTLQLPPRGPLAADQLLDLCRGGGTTVLFPATALWHEIARHVIAHPESLPRDLRLISFGGEKVSDKLLAGWLDEVGDRVRLVNGYGPTETTVEATLHDVTAALAEADPHATTSRIVGRPASEVSCKVLVPWLEAPENGNRGELCLDSPGMARGYLGQPAMTALTFVPNPFADTPGRRLYRTGDLVRQRPDGRLEILGRADQQVKIRGYRVEPGEVEAKLLEHDEVAEAQVVTGNLEEGELHLVAFVVRHRQSGSTGAPPGGELGNGSITSVADPASATGILGVGTRRGAKSSGSSLGDRLRLFLQRWLPPQHVPTRIVVLPKLPLNGNRKVDRFQLARRAETCLRQHHGPTGHHGSLEQKLATIWQRTLRLEEVALDDDFFNLGGDSILAIRAVTRAHEQGLRLTPKDIFSQRTLRRLAHLLRSRRSGVGRIANGNPLGRHTEGDDTAPLTPVQRWFFDEAQLANPHHFNQSMLLQVHDLDVSGLRRALDLLVAHHEALRLRFCRRGGTWRQVLYSDTQVEPHALLHHFDLRHSELDAEALSAQRPELWRRWSTSIQTSLDLRNGPLMRCGLFDFGPRRSSRLLLAIHHLVVDGVTWGILLRDLEQLYRNLTESGGPRGTVTRSPSTLAAVGTSYRSWARLQQVHAQSPELAAELPFWLAQTADVPPLPLDVEGADRHRDNTLSSIETVTLHLDQRHTEQLLRQLPAAYRTRINDVLLCAVAMALTSGGPCATRQCLIDVEGHGREEIAPGVDLSRTAGWFTTTFPVLLQVPGTTTTDDDLAANLKAVKEQLRQIPRHGIGFGCLFYLCESPEIRRAMQAMGRPEISFNYLGQLDAMLSGSRLFAPAHEPRGAEKCTHGRRPYALEIDGGVVGGELWVNWHFSRNLHHRSTLEAMVERCSAALHGLIEHCLHPDNGGLTPSDVPLSRLDQRALDAYFPQARDLEDIYPLTPMQEGMLFHHQLSTDSHLYFEQSSWTLVGPLQAEHWRHVWQRLVDLHPALRSCFLWRQVPRPLQVVHAALQLPWVENDLRHLSASAQEERSSQLLAEERERGFDLAEPPLCRMMLLRLGAERHRFVWSYHHGILDGWSIARLFDDAFALYADRQGANDHPDPEAPPQSTAAAPTPLRVTPFRTYVAWLANTEPPRREQHRRFWQRYLQGIQRPSLLGGAAEAPHALRLEGQRATPRAPRRTLRRTLDHALYLNLEETARRWGCTLAVLMQGAWAWLLSRHCDQRDVVFGSTVSCRPAELSGVEHIVGLMINTLPVRCRVDDGMPLASWLQALQENLVETRQHQHHPLADIQHLGPLAHDTPLFDHLLVFENYPTSIALEAQQERGCIRVEGFRGFDETNYTWTLGIVPGPSLLLDVSFDPGRLDPWLAQRLLARFENVLAGMVRRQSRRLMDIEPLTPGERHQVLCEWARGAPHAVDGETFLHCLLGQARKRPEAVAIVSPGESTELTYGQLVDQALALASRLLADADQITGPMGLAEEPVGILLERRTERVVASLAVLLAGGTYVPLETTYPPASVEQSCRVAGMGRLLSHPHIAQRLLSADTRHRLRLLPPSPAGEPPAGGGLPELPSGEQLAYVLFTSGSTGSPKAVAVSHRSLRWYCQVARRSYGLGPGDRVLHMAPVGFDFSICEIFPALAAGAALVLADHDTTDSVRQLFDFCRRREVSVVFPPTALWHQMVDEVVAAPNLLPPRLRLLASGGERLLIPKLDRWHRAVGSKPQLISGYGPTEVTVEASLVDLSSPRTVTPSGSPLGVVGKAEGSPLGRPLPGVRMYVLGRDLAPCGLQQSGEIYLAGPGLARGYLGRAAATATSFLPDPFAQQPGGRLYRTGDLGYFGPDGSLHITGRRDHQLKIRGHRIEPGAVETALMRLQGVGSAAVIGRRDNHGGAWLEAFVVPPEPSDGQTVAPSTAQASTTIELHPAITELRQQLSTRQPAHLIPSRIWLLDRLPQTPGGKIDRRRLRKLSEAAEAGLDNLGSPRRRLDANEQRVAALWQEVLATQELHADSNFFALGGHSLLATRLVQRLRQTFALEIPLRDIFIHPTLAEMAQRLKELAVEARHVPPSRP